MSDTTSTVQPYYRYPVEKVLQALETNAKTGLTKSEVAKRLQKYGPNELEKEKGESIWEKIKEQFSDLLVRILLLAAVISFVISLYGKSFKLFELIETSFFEFQIVNFQ
jgi:Cation transport ATPase